MVGQAWYAYVVDDLKEERVPETVLGIPAHPLLIHAAVAFLQLFAIGSAVYAPVPNLPARFRWVVFLLVLAGGGASFLAKLSGDNFRHRIIRRHLASPTILEKINAHKSFGDATLYAVLLLALFVLIFLFVTPGRRPLRRGET